MEAIWNCPQCGADVDGGFEICWACGTSRDGTPDPDFEVATAPIVEVDHVDPPSPGTALLLVLFLPALAIYGITKLAFPLKERRLQSVFGPLLLFLFLLLIIFLLYHFVSGVTGLHNSPPIR